MRNRLKRFHPGTLGRFITLSAVALLLAGCVPPSPLHKAAVFGDLEEMRVLFEQGADANFRPADGWTALHSTVSMMVVNSNPAAVKLLLEHGADPNAKTNDGYTPLHWAAVSYVGALTKARKAKLVEVGRMLIEADADPTLGSPYGRNMIALGVDPGRGTPADILRTKKGPFFDLVVKAEGEWPAKVAKLKATKAEEERVAKKKLDDERVAEFKGFVRKNTIEGYEEYLSKYPDISNKDEAYKRIVRLIKKRKDRSKQYSVLVSNHPDALKHVPAYYRVRLIGPESLPVYKIAGLAKSGMSEKIICSKIKLTNAEYKDFDMAEMTALKRMGITDNMISAMIDSTAKAKDIARERERDAQIQAIMKKVEAMGASQLTASAAGMPGVQSNMSAGNALQGDAASCVKQKLALEGCKRLPGGMIAQMVCTTAVKGKFPCGI